MENRCNDVKDLSTTSPKEPRHARPEELVSDRGNELASLLVGFGLGIGLAILFAPQSGEETREWISANVEDRFREVRRGGRRLVFEAQELLDRGEHRFSRVLRTGRSVLASVADKLD